MRPLEKWQRKRQKSMDRVIRERYRDDPAFKIGGGVDLEGELIIRNARHKGAQGPLSVRGCVAGTLMPPQSEGKKTRISMWRRVGSDLAGSSSERLVEGQIFGD